MVLALHDPCEQIGRPRPDLFRHTIVVASALNGKSQIIVEKVKRINTQYE